MVSMTPSAASIVFGLLVLITVSHASANYSIDYSKSSRYGTDGSLKSDGQERVGAAKPRSGLKAPEDMGTESEQKDIAEAKEEAKVSSSQEVQGANQEQAPPQVQAPVTPSDEEVPTEQVGEEQKPDSQGGEIPKDVSEQVEQEQAKAAQVSEGASMESPEEGDLHKNSAALELDGLAAQQEALAQKQNGVDRMSAKEMEEHLDSLKTLKSMTEQHIQQIQHMKDKLAQENADAKQVQLDSLRHKQLAAIRPQIMSMRAQLQAPEVWSEPQRASLLKTLDAINMRDNNMEEVVKSLLFEVQLIEKRAAELHLLKGTPDWLKHGDKHPAGHPSTWQCDSSLECAEGYYCSEPDREMLADSMGICAKKFKGWCSSNADCMDLFYCRSDSETPYGICSLKVPKHVTEAALIPAHQAVSEPTVRPTQAEEKNANEPEDKKSEEIKADEPEDKAAVAPKQSEEKGSENASEKKAEEEPKASAVDEAANKTEQPKAEQTASPQEAVTSEPVKQKVDKIVGNDSVVDKTEESEDETSAAPEQKKEPSEKASEDTPEEGDEKAEIEAAKDAAKKPQVADTGSGEEKDKKMEPAMADLVEVVPLQLLSEEEYAAAPESTVVRNEVNTNSNLNSVVSEMDLAEAPPNTLMGLRGECMQRTWKHCGFDAMNLAVNCDDPTIRDGPDYADYGDDKRLRVKIAFHVVGSGDDAEHKKQVANSINGALTTLREDYKQVNVHFGGEFFYWKNKELHETAVDRNDCTDSKIPCKLTHDFVKEIHGLADDETHKRFFDNHINIFVVNFKRTELLGYSFYPWDLQDPALSSAIIINQNVLGAKHRTLSHEMGSAMGLYHIFRGTAEAECRGCNPLTHKPDCYEREPSDITGDLVKDTLPAPRTFECAQPEGKIDACTNKPYGKVQYDNIMSYAPDSCMKSLTDQQGRRIRCWMTNGVKTRYFTQKECLISNKWTPC